VGSELLLHRNNFLGIQTPDASFKSEAKAFGLRIWSLGPHSSLPDLIIMIQIDVPNGNPLMRATTPPMHQHKIVFEMSDYPEFVCFMMLKTSGAAWGTSGAGLQVQVRKFHVPQICNRGNTYEMLVLPLLASVGQ
jgi:hypothetical protein